jgi:hypothetical protein
MGVSTQRAPQGACAFERALPEAGATAVQVRLGISSRSTLIAFRAVEGYAEMDESVVRAIERP